jgi:hypothetical protein
LGRLLNQKNSGGASPPRATATSGAWVYTPPLGRNWKQWDLVHRHLQKKKINKQSILFGYFLDLFKARLSKMFF